MTFFIHFSKTKKLASNSRESEDIKLYENGNAKFKVCGKFSKKHYILVMRNIFFGAKEKGTISRHTGTQLCLTISCIEILWDHGDNIPHTFCKM